MSDLELLRQYGRNRDQDAFAALVAQHLNLVYSAARRQVRSDEIAREVTQTVFVELSHQALRLSDDTHLASWLYIVARRRAIDALRREIRRSQLEKTAAELAAMKSNSPDWAQVEPVLDHALATLRARDRQAVLLRFFENKSLREIGTVLGITEDAAQKRLSRALERLRATLARRGIVTPAAALAAALAGNAVQAAPIGLSSAVATAVALGGGPVSAGVLTGGGGAAVSWLRHHAALLGLGAVIAIVWVAETGVVRAQARHLAALQTQYETLQTLRAERDRAGTHAKVAAMGAVKSGESSSLERRLREIVARIGSLRDALARSPAARTPEMVYVKESDWIAIAQQDWDAKTEAGLHRGLALLRLYGKSRLAPLLADALHRYLAANGGTPPGDAAQLTPFLTRSFDPAILARFSVVAGESTTKSGTAVRFREAAPATFDAEMDRVIEIGDGRSSLSPVGVLPDSITREIEPRLRTAAYGAALAYGHAHDAEPPATLDQLLPYFEDPATAVQVNAKREETTVKNTVAAAVQAYRNVHAGQEPATFEAVVPYFKTPAEAEAVRAFAARKGETLP